MSTTSSAQTDTVDQGSKSTSTKTARLVSYLRDEAADSEAYIKAKFIAEDVDLSPKEIGARLVQLQDSVQDLEIEQWSYTGATTWRISTV